MGRETSEVSIVIVDDEKITRLNWHYLRRNRPTNVIAFPMAPVDPADFPPHLLGDVVISAETAKRQAKAAGREMGEEILFLMIHGILHLLGYDHEKNAEDRREMEAKERELLQSVRGYK